jgi:hypothetical protein
MAELGKLHKFAWAAFLGLGLGLGLVAVGHAATVINTIPGARGTRLFSNDQGFGLNVSGIGDINGDGLSDVAISAPGVDRPGAVDVGAVYVLFGTTSVPATIDLSALNGSTGFKVTGNSLPANAAIGTTISGAGDINNDGKRDLLVGSPGRDRVYVVFGASTFASTLDVSALNGTNGFALTAELTSDRFGDSVAGGSDINGDGMDDFVVGATFVNSVGLFGGRAYVFFGRNTFPATVAANTATGAGGFTINPTAASDFFGIAAAMGGDVNNDGREDLIVSSLNSDLGASGTGSAYVIFGRPPGTPFVSPMSVNTLDGTALSGFAFRGAAANDGLGVPASFAGDVNGDGVGDLVAGAASNGTNGAGSGQTCILFGRGAGFSAVIDAGALNGTDGYCLNGEAANDSSGEVLGAGVDVNGDNLNDVIIGAGAHDLPGLSNVGRVYVVYGTASTRNASYNLSTTGSVGLPGEIFDGFAVNQNIAISSAIGKFNDTSRGVFAISDSVNQSVYLVTSSTSDVLFKDGFE